MDKTKYQHIIFGASFTLAFLTHPFGLYLLLSYGLFLLLDKNYKGFIQFNLIGVLVSLPWLLRNYYWFQDFGRGLYIPFSESISNYFWFLPHLELESDLIPTYSVSATNISFSVFSNIFSNMFPPFAVYSGLFSQMNEFFHMGMISIFIIIFTGFAFLSFDKITHKQIKQGCLYLGGIITTYTIAWQFLGVSETNGFLEIILQILFVYVLPICLILLFYKYGRKLFLSPIPNMYKFILISTLVTLILFYFYANNADRLVPVHKHFLFQMFILLPLSFIGLKNLAYYIISNKIKQKNSILLKNNYIYILIFIIFTFFLTVDLFQGIETEFNYVEKYKQETSETKQVNQYIRNNINPLSIIGTNHPYLTSHKTDHTSVLIPMLMYNLNDFDRYIENYNIDYLVFYWIESDIKNNLWEERKKTLQSIDSGKYSLEPITTIGNSVIIKIRNNQNVNSLFESEKYVKWVKANSSFLTKVISDPEIKKKS